MSRFKTLTWIIKKTHKNPLNLQEKLIKVESKKNPGHSKTGNDF